MDTPATIAARLQAAMQKAIGASNKTGSAAQAVALGALAGAVAKELADLAARVERVEAGRVSPEAVP